MSEETTTPEWVNSLPEGLRDGPFINNTPDLDQYVTQIKNAAQHIGNSIRIPGPDAGAEDWSKFEQRLQEKVPNLIRYDANAENGIDTVLERLGKPKEVTEYTQEESVKWLADIAHKSKLTKSQFNTLKAEMETWNKANQDATNAERAVALDAIFQEWGPGKDRMISNAIAFAEKSEAPAAFIEALKNNTIDPATLKWIASVSGKFTQSREPINDANNPETLTVPEASAQIQELLNNPQYFGNDAIAMQLRKRMIELQTVIARSK